MILRFVSVAIFSLVVCGVVPASAQIDPFQRNLLQLGYDQPLQGRGPQAAYVYYYYNDPEFLRTNIALRLAVAPVYLDGELGFKELLGPHTDAGLGISGGGFSDNFYEVRRGGYRRDESFEGYGGGSALKLYHRINPDQMIPLNAVVSGGFHYSTYSDTDETSPLFRVPDDRVNTFVRTGLRFAGKEPLLYPDLAMEISVWYERQWRLEDSSLYGFGGDRRVQSAINLYWLYACLNYAWTNTGHQFTFALTAGDSDHADRFSAWRLGGVLPLAAEFPLTLPGYYYQEISAQRFAHASASYAFPLSEDLCWQMRLTVASAYVDYIPGLGQSGHWHTGAGPELTYTSPRDFWRIVLRYGYGFNAERDGDEGAHSVGILCQFNFGPKKTSAPPK